MKKITFIVLAIFLIAILLGGLYLFKKSKSSLELTAQTQGKVLEINAQAGSFVKAGQSVVVIDVSKYKKELEEINLELEKAEKEFKISSFDINKIKNAQKAAHEQINKTKLDLDRANLDYEMYLNAYRDGAVTKDDLLKAKKNLETAHGFYNSALDLRKKLNLALEDELQGSEAQNAKIKELLSKIEEIEQNISKASVISPVEGLVLSLKVDIGKEVVKGQKIMVIMPKPLF